jgi:hypothetical protein
MKEHRAGAGGGGGDVTSATSLGSPGKRTLVEQQYGGVVQRKPAAGAAAAPQAAVEAGDHDHGQEPNPPGAGGGAGANLDATRPVGSNIPDDVRTQLMTEVRTSERMQQVLRDIEAHGGAAFDIKWSARGGFHSAGTIYIDRRQEMSSWIATLMHELNHLNDHRQGLNPDPATTASRAGFIDTKMRNEIRSHAISYVGLIEREGSGAAAASPPAGYTEFRAHLREREAAEKVCFASGAIQALAEAWVEAKYRNEWTTSNTGENYYVYWGRIWDEAHPGGH